MALAGRAPSSFARHAAALAVALVAGCGGRGCTREPVPSVASAPSAASVAKLAPAPVPTLRVPHVAAPVTPDGELDEAAWNAAARTGPFATRTAGHVAQRAEGRFLWDERFLYVALDAADHDLRAAVEAHDGAVWTDDAFSLRFAPAGEKVRWTIDVSVGGAVCDVREGADGARDPSWESGATVGVDRDGTLNDPRDEDEEWAVEVAIPLASLELSPRPGASVGVRLGVCDVLGAERRCAAWNDDAVIVLDAREAMPAPSAR